MQRTFHHAFLNWACEMRLDKATGFHNYRAVRQGKLESELDTAKHQVAELLELLEASDGAKKALQASTLSRIVPELHGGT